jgi:hypothetical protein
MNSFTNDCEHVFHSVESVQNHFIMDWKNALSHFKTYVEKIDIIDDIADDLFEDADMEEEEPEPEQEQQDFCIFQFEL